MRVDGPERFRTKCFVGTTLGERNVTDQLLDGQHKLTAIQSSLNELYSSRTVTASIKIEIEAECLEGFDEVTQRTIKENCNTLKFDLSEFE